MGRKTQPTNQLSDSYLFSEKGIFTKNEFEIGIRIKRLAF